jgi:hypothetical protein
VIKRPLSKNESSKNNHGMNNGNSYAFIQKDSDENTTSLGGTTIPTVSETRLDQMIAH